jgi:hypothetical protein
LGPWVRMTWEFGLYGLFRGFLNGERTIPNPSLRLRHPHLRGGIRRLRLLRLSDHQRRARSSPEARPGKRVGAPFSRRPSARILGASRGEPCPSLTQEECVCGKPRVRRKEGIVLSSGGRQPVRDHHSGPQLSRMDNRYSAKATRDADQQVERHICAALALNCAGRLQSMRATSCAMIGAGAEARKARRARPCGWPHGNRGACVATGPRLSQPPLVSKNSGRSPRRTASALHQWPPSALI